MLSSSTKQSIYYTSHHPSHNILEPQCMHKHIQVEVRFDCFTDHITRGTTYPIQHRALIITMISFIMLLGYHCCLGTVARIPLLGYHCLVTIAWLPLLGYHCSSGELAICCAFFPWGFGTSAPHQYCVSTATGCGDDYITLGYCKFLA